MGNKIHVNLIRVNLQSEGQMPPLSLSLFPLTQHAGLLKIAMRVGTDPGIRGTTLFEAGGPGPSPRKILDFRGFVIHFCYRYYEWVKIDKIS